MFLDKMVNKRTLQLNRDKKIRHSKTNKRKRVYHLKLHTCQLIRDIQTRIKVNNLINSI